MKKVNNLELTAWSIAIVLSIGSLTLSLSKNSPDYVEIVSETDNMNENTTEIKEEKDIEFVSTAMEEYRAFDSNASTNIYLYQIQDEITNNWVTLDIISKKEYENPPELLRDGRLVYAGKYNDNDTVIGVYQVEIKDANSNWVKLEEYELFDEPPFETKTKRYIYLGEDLKRKNIKID